MSELQSLLREALINNSYDHDPMHDTLRKTWENSYSYLYGLQKAYVEYEELMYYSNEETGHNSELIGNLYLDNQLHACFDIDFDLIHVYSRESFRRSEYYQKEFWFQDIIKHNEIFLKVPIVLIDNQVIWNYKMKITKDCTTFILPFRRPFVLYNDRNTETDDVIYVDHDIQVLIVDNIYWDSIKINRVNGHYKSNKKTLTIGKHLLSEENEYPGIMMCSIHFPSKNNHYEDLGSPLFPMKDVGDAYEVTIPESYEERILNMASDFMVHPIFINHLFLHEFYTGKTTTSTEDGRECNLIVLQKEEMVPYNMPIPIENFMVFKRKHEEEVFHLIKNTDSITLHYPNIYRITDPTMECGDTYRVFYFYYQPDMESFKYTPLHEFYYMFLVDTFKGMKIEKILDKIYRQEMDYGDMFTPEQLVEFRQTFKYIINYQYFKHNYGEIDFLHRYTKIDGNKNKTPWQYQVETLKDWIRVEPNVLREYVRQQKTLGDSYHLFTNTLDLTKRLRTDTSNELGIAARSFEEPRYVFAFKNERDYPLLLDCRVFVDGLIITDLIQERSMFMDYLYIPTKLVTEDSYIEIEVFPNYSFSHTMHFEHLLEEQEVAILEPDDNIYPTFADLYFSVSKDYDVRYTRDFFKVQAQYEQGIYELESEDPKKPVQFTRLSRFKVQPISPEVIGRDVTLHFSKIPHGLEVYIDRPGYPYIEFIDRDFNFNIKYLRIFRNGRLVPVEKYLFFYSYDAPRIQLLDWCEKGEYLYLDVTPYQYTQIYYQENLDPENPIIDLKGIINKPFDIRYYDVYLNGRRLSINNVFSVDPWSITLVNLKSTHHLTIYEKERDWEYFGLNYHEGLYYFNYEDLFKKSFVSEEERNEMIRELIDHQKDHRLTINPNTDEEEPVDYTDLRNWVLFHSFYYYELIPKNSINPDTKQFNSGIIQDEYWSVYNTYHKKATEYARDNIEKADRRYHPDILYLDPDSVFQGDPPEEEQWVFPVGHLDNDMEEKMVQTPISVNEDYKIGGEE